MLAMKNVRKTKKMLANKKKAWTTIIAKIDEKWGRGHFRASFNSKAHPDPNRRSYGKRNPLMGMTKPNQRPATIPPPCSNPAAGGERQPRR